MQGIDTVLKARLLLRRPTRDKDLGQSVKSPTPGRTLGRRASDIKRQALGGAPALLKQMTELKVMYLKSLPSTELKELKIKPSTFLLPEATRHPHSIAFEGPRSAMRRADLDLCETLKYQY